MLKSTQECRTKKTHVTSLMAAQHERNIHHTLAVITGISRNGTSLGKGTSPACLVYQSGGINSDELRNRRVKKKKKKRWLSEAQ